MKKQTKVLLAAAALTLGASFSAMAAEKTYDWKVVDGEWVCYNEDAEPYDNEWVKSAGKDYLVGDNGVLATSQWFEGCYVDSTGAKTINNWKYIFADGEEDLDDAEEAWFYFGSKGAITKGKKVIDGKTYYFDSEGKMITGWVDVDTIAAATEDSENVVYTNEDGARVANVWLKSVAPGVDEEEETDPTYYWYYLDSKGAPKTGRALDINGETYFFNAAGQMLYGWVTSEVVDDVTVYTNADAALSTYTNDVYFCGDKNEGWAKKSAWINEYRNTVDSADADEDDMYWFWLDKNGKLLRAKTNTASNASEQVFASKNNVTDKVFDAEDMAFKTTHAATKEINGKDYIFNQNGEMLSGLVKFYGNTFYYGEAEDGSMKTGEIALEEATDEESYNFYFATTKKNGYKAVGAAVTGAAGGKLYKDGILVKHSADNDYKVETVNGLNYVIDKNGNIKTSQKQYKAYDEEAEKNLPYLDTRNFKFEKKDGVAKGSFTVE